MYTLIDSDNMFLVGSISYTGRNTPIIIINSKTNDIWKAIRFSKKSNILKSIKTAKVSKQLKLENISIKELELRTLG